MIIRKKEFRLTARNKNQLINANSSMIIDKTNMSNINGCFKNLFCKFLEFTIMEIDP